MAVIPFVGGSYRNRSVNFSADRSVNLYPTKSETGDSKAVSALVGTPGNILFCTFPTSKGRGAREVLGRGFVVSGNTLYEISSNGTFVSRGTLITDTFFVSMSDNGQQLCIVDGPYGYIFTLATNVFTQITDSYFLGATTVSFIGGYFMFNKPNSQIYYISALYDGLTGDPLDFASAETSPDGLVAIIVIHSQVVLAGSRTIEFAVNSPDGANFPFEIQSGSTIEYGCAAPYSLVATANTAFFLGKDALGQGVVWMLNGYQPQRISTFAVEYAIQQYGDISDAIGYAYQEDGHYFYVLNFTNAQTTWVYDINLDFWHERARFVNGVYLRARPQNHIFIFNKHLVTDFENSNLYEQSLNYYQDNGSPIRRMRTAQHISEDLKYIYFNSFQLDMEAGVGVQSDPIQNSDPQVMLQWSDDGAHTWSNEHWRSFGKVGQYALRVIWRRLGRSRDRVFSAIITASCKVYIIAAHVDVQMGKN